MQVQVQDDPNDDEINNDDDINGNDNNDNNDKDASWWLWRDCLFQGRNRLVIRQWRGGSQWWNLHQNRSVQTMATNEVQGYRWARQALQRMATTTNDNDDDDDNHQNNEGHQHEESPQGRRGIVIPRILYSETNPVGGIVPPLPLPQEALSDDHHDHDDDREECWYPWAIFEYVGPESMYFYDTFVDRTWVDGMVPIRREFGLDEPHPRWGRVPEESALDYATMILCQVVIPLQIGWKQMDHHSNIPLEEEEEEEDTGAPSAITYDSMVQRYQQVYDNLRTQMKNANYDSNGEEDNEQHRNLETIQRFDHLLDILHHAIETVLPTWCIQFKTAVIPSLEATLCHMDLQPQNILCSRDNTGSSMSSNVVAVLDWEDAAMADPRFEILLLGRKVCAHREQAETIWKLYAQRTNQPLGPLLPWLQLESVHSLLTMLLQSMDMLNGGRNPWETSKELGSKMEREIVRWNGMWDETLLLGHPSIA